MEAEDETAEPGGVGVTGVVRSGGGRRWVRRRSRLTVLVVVVVVALVVGGAWWWRHRDTENQAHSPEGAVRGYLTAIAENRADDALAFLEYPPLDRTFLTDDVLAESHALAPMTDIAVEGVRHRPAWPDTVTATYKVGDDSYTTTFEVLRRGSLWSITHSASEGPLDGDVLPKVSLISDRSDIHLPVDVPVLVNGVPATSTSWITMFPGRYRVTSGHALFDLDQQFTAVEDTRRPAEVLLSPRLNDDGARRVADAAQAEFDACLAQHSFATDCGFLGYGSEFFSRAGSGGSPGYGDALDWPVDPTTISWSATGADLSQPDLDRQKGYSVSHGRLYVRSTIDVQLTCTWTGTAGEQVSWEDDMPPGAYRADITDPDHIAVVFGGY